MLYRCFIRLLLVRCWRLLLGIMSSRCILSYWCQLFRTSFMLVFLLSLFLFSCIFVSRLSFHADWACRLRSNRGLWRTEEVSFSYRFCWQNSWWRPWLLFGLRFLLLIWIFSCWSRHSGRSLYRLFTISVILGILLAICFTLRLLWRIFFWGCVRSFFRLVVCMVGRFRTRFWRWIWGDCRERFWGRRCLLLLKREVSLREGCRGWLRLTKHRIFSCSIFQVLQGRCSKTELTNLYSAYSFSVDGLAGVKIKCWGEVDKFDNFGVSVEDDILGFDVSEWKSWYLCMKLCWCMWLRADATWKMTCLAVFSQRCLFLMRT